MVKKMVVLFFVTVVSFFSCSDPNDSASVPPASGPEYWTITFTVTSTSDSDIQEITIGNFSKDGVITNSVTLTNESLPWSLSMSIDDDYGSVPYLYFQDSTGTSGVSQDFSGTILLENADGKTDTETVSDSGNVGGTLSGTVMISSPNFQ